MMKPLYAINKFRYNSVHDVVCKKAKKNCTKSETKKNCLCAHEHIRTKDTISGWRKEERTVYVCGFIYVCDFYFIYFFAVVVFVNVLCNACANHNYSELIFWLEILYDDKS